MAQPAILANPPFCAPPARVGYSAMATRKYGRDLIRRLIPAYFRTQTELQNKTGLSYSSINDWANGKSDPRLEQLDKIAQAIKETTGEEIEPLELLLGPQAKSRAPRIREQPWWERVLAEAMKLFPRTPLFAFEHVGALMGEQLPPADPLVIGQMASAWYQAASDEEKSEALIAKAEREMAAEDETLSNPSAPRRR